MSAPSLLVCGSLTIDNVMTAADALLPPAPAGNVVYAALGAAFWSDAVGLVSRAGADFPADFLARLADRGLDIGGIARLDAPHGMNVAFAYAADGSRVRAFPPARIARIPAPEQSRFVDYTTRGAEHRFATWLDFAPDAADIPPAWVAMARGAHLAAMPVQRQASLAQGLAGRPVHLDSFWHDEREPARDFVAALASDVTLFLPSEADLAIWRPDLTPLHAAEALARASGRPVVLKRGGAGARLIAPGMQLDVPAFPAPVQDPTGAGDAFCGGVLAGLLRTGDLRRALACGTASASFAIGAPGLAGLIGADRAEAERRADWVAARISIRDDTEREAS